MEYSFSGIIHIFLLAIDLATFPLSIVWTGGSEPSYN